MASEKPSRAKRSSSRKPAKERAAGSGSRGRSGFPDRIFALASPHSIGGVSMFEAGRGGRRVHGRQLRLGSRPRRARGEPAGRRRLRGAPGDVADDQHRGEPRAAYEQAFATKLFAEERPVVKQQGQRGDRDVLRQPGHRRPGLVATTGTRFEEVLEGVAIEEPAYPWRRRRRSRRRSTTGTSTCRPTCRSAATPTRRTAAASPGTGINVAMVDTGWQSATRSSRERGYRVDASRCSGPAPRTRPSTRAATAPASRPTSSPSRRTWTLHAGEDVRPRPARW